MSDTTQIGGLSFKFDADMTAYMDGMKEAEKSHRAAASSLAAAFEQATAAVGAGLEGLVEMARKHSSEISDAMTAAARKVNEAWSDGAEGAEKSVKEGFESIETLLDTAVGFGAARGGWVGKAFGLAWIAGLGDVIKGGFGSLKPRVAAALDDLLGGEAAEKLTTKVADAFRSFGQGAIGFGVQGADLAGFNFGAVDRARTKVDEWAEAIKVRLDELVDGARTALQKLAGTFDGITDAGQKAIERLKAGNQQLRDTYDLFGLSKREAAEMKAWMDGIAASGKKLSELSAADLQGIAEQAREKGRLTEMISDWQTAEQKAKEYERTVNAVTAALRRQVDAHLANADAFGKTPEQRFRARAAAMFSGRGIDVSGSAEVQATVDEGAPKARDAAEIAFNNELTAAVRAQQGAYQLLGSTIGATAGETAKLKFEQQELNTARKAGLYIDPEIIEKQLELGVINKGTAEEMYASNEKVRASIANWSPEFKRTAQAMAEMQERAKQFMDVGRTMASSLESAFGSWINGTKTSFKSLMEDMGRDLARLSFRLALMPIFGGGVSGSLWGNVGKALGFGGFMAEGGPLDQGKWYIAGERGPEPVWGGGPGAFAAGYGRGSPGMGGGGPVTINMRIDLEGANGDETIARISAHAARAAAQQAVQVSNEAYPAVARQHRLMAG